MDWKDRVETVEGDITQMAVEAIVNAANANLEGGGGVDGAIHRAAGPELLEECRNLGGCQPGDAKTTTGHGLLAKCVIHAVGPRWKGGDQNEDATLRSAYRRSLQEARDHGCRTVAFPAISTGAYGFPVERAAGIAVDTVRDFLIRHDTPAKVVFCCFSDGDRAVFEQTLRDAR